MAITTAMRTQASQLYVALFGRAPDSDGLGFWVNKLGNGDSVASVANAMFATDPARAYYPTWKTNQEIIESFYLNVLGRAADTAGRDFWTGKLNAAGATAGSVIAEMISVVANYTGTDAAGVTSAALFNNKVTVAQAYAEAGGNAAGATSILSTVTSAASTVTAALATISSGGVVSGQTFTLTTGTDSEPGTTANDTFQATVGRLTANDYLNGAGGNDVLNAGLNGSGADTAIIENIETLNIQTYSASELSGALISGATAVNVTGNSVLTYTNADGEEFSLSGEGVGLTTNAAATTDTNTQSITIDLKSGALGTVTLGEASGSKTDFDVINLKASGATSVTLTETSGGFTGTGEQIVVTGGSNLVLNIAGAAIGTASGGSGGAEATITATAHTGVLTLDIGDFAANDWLDLSKVTGVDVVRAGMHTANAVNGIATGMTVRVDKVNAATDDLTLAVDGSATTDAVTLVLQHGTNGTSVAFDDLTVTGIETTTINSTGTDTSTATVSNSIGQIIGTAGSKLVLTGDKVLTIAQIDNEFTTIDSTNSVGVDITLEATSAVTVNGGAGNDRVEFDTVADLGTGDSVTGGSGNDTLAFSAVIGTDLSSTQRGLVSGFEVLEYEGAQTLTAAATTVDLTAEGFTTLYINGVLTHDGSGASGGVLTVTAASGNTIKLGASATSGGDAAAQFVVAVTNAANAGTNDIVNLQMVDAPSGDYAFGGLTINDVERLSVALLGDEVSGDVVTISDVDGAQLQSITITSANTGKNTDGTLKKSDSLTITDASSTILSNIDASAFTGALTMTGLSDNLIGTGATIKGGSGVDAITGGGGGDTISANDGNDDLSGGNGADIIDGGAGDDDIEGDGGNDNLIGGNGNDVITGGAGNDTLTLGAGSDIVELATGSTDTVTDFVFGAGGDIIDLSTAGNNAAVDLLDDTDGTAKVVSATSTDALTVADNEVLFVTVAAIASLDSKAEIAALFAASGKAFEAVTASDQFTLLIRDEATSKVYVYDLEESGVNTSLADAADTVELIGILDNVSASAFDRAVVGNFQQ